MGNLKYTFDYDIEIKDCSQCPCAQGSIKSTNGCWCPLTHSTIHPFSDERLPDCPLSQPSQEPCEWCNQGKRFEYNLIDDNGNTIVENNMVLSDIAKYCPNCGRKLEGCDKP